MNHRQYDVLEYAILRGERVAIQRRGTEFVLVPLRLRTEGKREALEAKHPTTGERMVMFVDEIERVEAVR